MLSRIDDSLNLLVNGSVMVCGPITWEANETSADFGFVMRQADRLLVGKSSANPGQNHWMGANLQRIGGKFTVGPATGTVVVVVRRNNPKNPVLTASWTQDVLLEPPPA
jgi:hypothetical protein